MKQKNKKINESVTESAISPLTYIVFIDAGSVIEGSRGYIKMMFPDQTPSAIKMMFKSLVNSNSYGEVSDSLKGISSRFSNNPALKALFNTLKKIKSSSYAESDREQHENDIELLIKRVSIFIKRKLTEEDVSVLEMVLSEINTVAESISREIDKEVELLLVKSEEPARIEVDEPKSKTEIKVNERLKNKLRKKIKEIIRTHLFSVKNL